MNSSRKISLVFAAGLVAMSAMAAGPAVAVGPVSSTAQTPVLMPSTTSYEEALNWLKENSGEQTPQSIIRTEALASDAVHVEEYIGEEGEVLAAVAVRKPSPGQRSLSWTSPGCTTTGACLTAGGRYLGYTGTGQLAGSWSNVSRIAAGNVGTGLWNGAHVNYVVANKAATYRSPISGNSLYRG